MNKLVAKNSSIFERT